jgi:hypothetical protein
VDKEDMEEVDEMEIGCPTDVKHVTHIGWDGGASATASPVMGWDNLVTPQLLSLPSPSPSLEHFHLSRADHETDHLLINTST